MQKIDTSFNPMPKKIEFPRADIPESRQIKKIPHFKNSQYKDLNIFETLEYMRRRFVIPIDRLIPIRDKSLIDVASGYGWLSFAFLRSGGGHAILVDVDEDRLAAAASIASALGLHERCEFVVSSLSALPFRDHHVDILASIETLEHVGKTNVDAAVANISRVARTAILITTPNYMFPKLNHDTRLPFAHWAPPKIRNLYAKLFKKEKQNNANYFLQPADLRPIYQEFECQTSFYGFSSFEDYLQLFPMVQPYGANGGTIRQKPKKLEQSFWWMLGTIAKTASWKFAPNMASIWTRAYGKSQR